MSYGFWYLSQAHPELLVFVWAIMKIVIPSSGNLKNWPRLRHRRVGWSRKSSPSTHVSRYGAAFVAGFIKFEYRLRYHRFQFTSCRRSRCGFGDYWKQCPRSNRFSSRHPFLFTCVWNCRYTCRFWLLLPIVLLSHYFENAAPSWCRFRFRPSPAVPFRSVFANRWYPNNHTDWFPWKTDHFREKKIKRSPGKTKFTRRR